MKNLWVVFLLGFVANAPHLFAQKDSTAIQPNWAAGIYGSVSVGYGAFTQPFKNYEPTKPYPSFAATGMVFQWDGGIAFRNHWGLRVSASWYAANNLSANIVHALEATYPGYFLDYTPTNETINKTVNHFAVGVSYAFPRQRWCFQPEILIGSTEVSADWATAQAKELGTHKVVVLRYTPENTSYRSPTLTIGSRATWYAGWYLGVFADARLNVLFYNTQYQVEKTLLIEQSVDTETIQLKKTALGATASVGVFLQIARWEAKGQRR